MFALMNSNLHCFFDEKEAVTFKQFFVVVLCMKVKLQYGK